MTTIGHMQFLSVICSSCTHEYMARGMAVTAYPWCCWIVLDKNWAPTTVWMLSESIGICAFGYAAREMAMMAYP